MSQSYYRSFIKDNAVVIVGHIVVYMKGIILMPIIIKTVGVTIYGGFVLHLLFFSENDYFAAKIVIFDTFSAKTCMQSSLIIQP